MVKQRDLELFNKSGDELCHAITCRKHKKLIEKFNGKFCPYHIKLLEQIRTKLKKFAENGNIHEEMIERRKEVLFRKKQDPGHISYLKILEIRYYTQLKAYAGDDVQYQKEYDRCS